jgi:hypothetical protein
MSKIFAIWRNLTDKDKLEVIFALIFILIGVIVVLLGIAWSRGHDVDYFKERIVIMDQNLAGMNKRMTEQDLRFDKIVEATNETRQALNNEITRNNEQEKWIEYWKSLPSLPKPKNTR